MYDRILVPTDGSEQHAVVTQAMNLAELADATVHALYVVDERALDYQPSESGREETRDARREEGEAATQHVAEAGEDRGVEVVTAIEEGTPAQAIVEYADAEDVDVVVMGTHGRSGVDRYVLGSVTEQVVRTSEVPVLTVNLARQRRAVRDDETAVERAKQVLADEGHAVADVPEDPYRESNTWLVRVETEDGETFNVHIDAASGEARLARIGK
ncbi:universal stress protein [Halorussus gelatinilyticus]|uniref:Universal stress protein n=1 Tax=Halorussus gelatinilyticus TaxID=2937524 RepID=A0A8U0IMN4_9EURY|nr:universal stress protein [Halorussus gelatinilyticus]UPW01454.1 universal stress protein [Halorussus gelatinilyticus]